KKQHVINVKEIKIRLELKAMITKLKETRAGVSGKRRQSKSQSPVSR
ncbi:hypothetical protein LEP1GSC116_3826, partial [Leptospira interrogans serovar Icterohaemorrhagiae str. Verdun HP]